MANTELTCIKANRIYALKAMPNLASERSLKTCLKYIGKNSLR